LTIWELKYIIKQMKQIKIRMCVACRKRDLQANLYRLQCKDKKLMKFSGSGRSFYVCKSCVDSKKFIKYLSKLCDLKKEEIILQKRSLFEN
jgi:predicted RNA-binding protein YlxR (DUF448 family)